ncbi:Isochorismatase hydrolase [Penicillium macrosclerotiorum]|uniref:Isochorismatase hydrolase n=1 Tax=Penicillium macrosclerotiorum TaxID=303699 RepID=UPI002548E07C|nr:Isochorismatase hydrolase [Penicillium macrosclerotiorum]KAJ5679370.1 Isochorismatase hydrolase [Penicillium macrosclerotiorum]
MFDSKNQATPGYYGPSQTALLLLDFHSLFVQHVGGLKAPVALGVAAEMRAWARTKGIRVIHCLIDIHATPFATCKDAPRFVEIAKTMQSGGGEESTELLTDKGNDVTFTRRPGYVSALKSPGLNEFLQSNGIKSLILTGLSTSGCVTRTALAANDAEYVVSILSDGCADREQEIHDLLIEKMLNNRGFVASSSEFRKGYESCLK